MTALSYVEPSTMKAVFVIAFTSGVTGLVSIQL